MPCTFISLFLFELSAAIIVFSLMAFIFYQNVPGKCMVVPWLRFIGTVVIGPK